METSSSSTLLCPVLTSLSQLHREISDLRDGRVATYIPELAKANPDWFGICLATANGSVYEVGDTDVSFTIQSISKPFVYGLALEDNGRRTVMEKISVEPTGDAFNSISLEPGTGRPRNPMINAGAIAATGLIGGKSPENRFKRILEFIGNHAGRELKTDPAVYRSESETGHRNRAIGHMLRNFEILTADPMPIVELYFQQCAISVTCRDLALMAATLANRGVNPITGKQALRSEYVESVLSVMESCGMYDFSGRWVFEVGMPAKSGVSGGILAVLPGQLGIGVFSPPLDPQGNSVRGIRVCQDLSRYLDLHLLNRPAIGRLTIRRRVTGKEAYSNRVRTTRETEQLRRLGDQIQLYQLQGNLAFSTMEVLVSEVLRHPPEVRYLLFDLRRVLSLNESACHLFHQLLTQLHQQQKAAAFTHSEHLPILRRYLRRRLGDAFEQIFRAFPDNDHALEWAEDHLLTKANPPTASIPGTKSAATISHQILEDLTEEQLAAVNKVLKRRTFQKGETLVSAGDPADEMFLLEEGSVSVLIDAPNDRQRRLAAFSPGMSFGEMAMIDHAPRSARIVGDTDGVCLVLRRPDLERLEQAHPDAMLKILRNLCRSLSARLRKANVELATFD